MTAVTNHVHLDNAEGAEVELCRHDRFMTVDLTVQDAGGFSHRVNFFCHDEAEVAIIMKAMAKGAREYFASIPDPEPDWEAIAASMDDDYHAEASAGL